MLGSEGEHGVMRSVYTSVCVVLYYYCCHCYSYHREKYALQLKVGWECRTEVVGGGGWNECCYHVKTEIFLLTTASSQLIDLIRFDLIAKCPVREGATEPGEPSPARPRRVASSGMIRRSRDPMYRSIPLPSGFVLVSKRGPPSAVFDVRWPGWRAKRNK